MDCFQDRIIALLVALRHAFKWAARVLLPAKAYRRIAFSRVYRNNSWGSDGKGYFSGYGSRGQAVDLYIDAIARTLENPRTIVDLGCGDMEVGRRLIERFPDARYIGCDLVPELIEHHRRTFQDERFSFQRLDMVSDPIPQGDVYLVRQVFQHLSNADISKILQKLESSPCLIVTDAHPLTPSGEPNADKVAGREIRFDTTTGVGSGVYLDLPPFNKKIEELCRIEMPGSEYIVTWRVAEEISSDLLS